MRAEMTYNDLFSIEHDIRNIRHSPGFSFLLGDKIKRFYQLNKIRIDLLHKNLGAMQSKYIQQDDKGQPMHLMVNDKPGEWIFKDSFTNGKGETIIGADEAKKMYYEEANEFLSRTITVEL